MRCPTCDALAIRVIYMGLPMWLCDEHDEAEVWGLFTKVFEWGLPFNGIFMGYEGMSYWRALYRWFTTEWSE